jgi:UDP-N-acetylglucosamine--N-acetylmuramyl-(pentapeptide) pyrophosphoryl-undecaprenol N-acetylglucosamine transferase
MRRPGVIISGGGTGGHLYPALVVGRKLLELAPQIALTYVGTRREVEGRIMADHGVRFIPMRIEGLKGRGLKSLRGLAVLPFALAHALGILVRTRPALVVGVGGYSSGPIVLLASWFRVPTVVLEQNARPGFTNRLLARWVRRAVVAFPSTLPAFRGKGVALGNPVREGFYTLPAKARGPVLDVLVFGGSQGSHFLNARIVEALPLLAAAKDRLRLVHQTGTNDVADVATAYKAAGYDGAEVAAYLPDMPAYFGRADLIVCRAGATTLAELIAARKAALIVPFAGAADDHQTANARELEAVGGAVVVPESEATAEALAARVLRFLARPEELDALERNVGRLQAEDPAGRIAALCLSLMTPARKESPA